MKTKSVGSYQITVFSTRDGDELFIEKNGREIYKCRTNRTEGFEFAIWVINNRLNNK